MKSFILILAGLASVVSSNNFYQPYTTYHPAWMGMTRSMDAIDGNQEELMGMIRLQSARMTEITMAAKPQEQMLCFKRSVCVVGATMEVKESRMTPMNPITLAKGIDQFRKILELMVSDIEQSADHHVEDFPNIYQVLGSHSVGQSVKDVALCERLFPCETGLQEVGLTAPQRQGRATCAAIGAVCPGVSIGCAVCGVFAPGTCGDQCIVAGLYCGSSLLACGHKSQDQAVRKTNKKTSIKSRPKFFPAPTWFQ